MNAILPENTPAPERPTPANQPRTCTQLPSVGDPSAGHTMGEYPTLLERVLNHLPEDAAYGVSASLATGGLHLSVNQEHIETALSVMGMDPTPSMAWPMDHDPQYEHVRWIGPVDGISVILGTWRPIAAQDPVAVDAEDVTADAEGTTADIENPDSVETTTTGVGAEVAS